MLTIGRLRIAAILVVSLALLVPAVLASTAAADGIANAVAVRGSTPPHVTWAAPHRAPSVSGVAKGKDCTVRVKADETLKAVRIKVAGRPGVAYLLPKDLRRIKDRSVRGGAFQCAVDTTHLANGPVQLTATAITATGQAKSASKEIVVANQPPTAAPEPAPTTPPAAGGSGEWFSPTSFWNRQLPSNAPLATQSSTYVNELVRQVNSAGPWIDTNEYSVPIYTVPANQPTVKVIQRQENGYVNAAMNSAFAAVPIPADAKPAAGTDRHMVIYQPSTGKMWEFWCLEKQNGQWIAQWGAAIQNVSQNKGYIDSSAWPGSESGWGATATSLPLAGGLIRMSELEAGQINHALAIAIPETASSYVWPAQRSDGSSRSSSAIPEGTIFRLPASLNIPALHLPKVTEEMALAAQRYGIVVRDRSGCVSFYAEDPTPVGGDPYHRLFEGQYPNNLLARFPFSSLQVVQPGT
jgi:hypothetical protein